jgi:pimeloyl-ACP methyl ester carboxylesterase
MHGTQGFGNDSTTAFFNQSLRGAGYAVFTPTMCWSRSRIYDAAFPDCLHEIDGAVATLKSGGARRIVVGGQSQGGNAALAYGAQHPELAGVIALAPAPRPDMNSHNPAIARSFAEAKAMIAGGESNRRASFAAMNNGQMFTVVTTAAIYVSFVDPDGPAEYPNLLANVRPPVIWVAGSEDPTQRDAASLFTRLPANPLNRLVMVNAVHLGTPGAGTPAVLEWLKALGAQPPS